MKHWLIVLLFLLAGQASAADESEALTCSAESSPDEWAELVEVGCTIVEDASDLSFYEETTDFHRQRWAIDNTGYTWTTIDSVVIGWRYGGKGAKVQPIAFDIFVGTDSTMGGEFDCADATIRDTSISYALAPDGGAWVGTDVDGLEVQVRAGDIGGGGGDRVYEYDITVWGTQEAGPEGTVVSNTIHSVDGASWRQSAEGVSNVHGP